MTEEHYSRHTDSDTDFHGGKETFRLALCDIGFSYVVKELKLTNPKHFT
jgi:hypothetical protein